MYKRFCNKCDREIKSDAPMLEMDLWTTNDLLLLNKTRTIHLCENCVTSLKKWLDNDENK